MKKKRQNGLDQKQRLPGWVLGLFTGLCAGLVLVGLGGLTVYTVLMRGAHEEFSSLAQQVHGGGSSRPGEQEERPPQAYAELKAQNQDFVGWLRLEGTALDYPVVQTPHDPQYYLRRGFDGRYSVAGTPFLDARCDMESGASLIVYGHNMNDGSMFAVLQNYLEEDYGREHPRLWCDSMTQRREYEVMAVLRVNDSPETAANYYAVPGSEEEFTAWVARLRAAALYDTGVEAVWGEQVLCLSTCDRTDRTARILVAAKRIDEGKEEP